MNLFGKSNVPRIPRVRTERKDELRLFERNTGIRFKNLEILNLALTHRSYANENENWRDNNERLEFLGDSVLGLVVCEYLYKVLVDKNEGELARIKSFVASENILSQIAHKLGINEFLLIGKGEENSGGREKKAILADTFEALVGAYFLDSGLDACRKFLLHVIVPEINRVLEDRHKKDYKTLLQELVQKKLKIYPRYQLVSKEGPDHDKTFIMEVLIGEESMGKGTGKNKKDGEQKAAAMAYRQCLELWGEG